MMISTKGRYAVRVMLALCDVKDNAYVSLKSISENENISEKYMESIVSMLVKKGFIEGIRGKGGGYKLKITPEDITVGSILKATDGSLAPVACLECKPNKCDRASECRTLPVWERLDKIIDDYLENITLADVYNESVTLDSVSEE